jgi:hypothetical protein
MVRPAIHGAAIVTDDLVVRDGSDVLAGPGHVDRSRRLDTARELGAVGMWERWRVEFAASLGPPACPLVAGSSWRASDRD